MEKRVRSNWTMSDPDQDAWNDLADELEKANARIQWLEGSVDDHMEIAEKYSTRIKGLEEENARLRAERKPRVYMRPFPPVAPEEEADGG